MKPILFNTEMVKAIMDGRKTMTRRLIKPQPKSPVVNFLGTWQETQPCANGIRVFPPPYKPGDILYVRETWTELCYVDPDGYTHFDQSIYYYAADGTPDITLVDGDGFELDDQRIKWKPSIHMPKELARIFLRVKSVRVERLQKCGEGWCIDIEKEGVKTPQYPILYVNDDRYHAALRAEMKKLWDSTIKPTDLPTYGWDANPWVWVIEFEQCDKPKEDL